MPIHINEIIIKATVQDDKDRAKSTGGGALNEKAKQKIIEECVEQVMDMLHRKKDR